MKKTVSNALFFAGPPLSLSLLPLLLGLMLMISACGVQTPSGKYPRGMRPYTVHGKTYYPLKSAVGYSEKGYASWYGPNFHGRPTASGEIYDQNAMTCAHRILPFGTTLRVTNLSNKKEVIYLIFKTYKKD